MNRAVLSSMPPHSRENAVPCGICARRTWSQAALCIAHEHLSSVGRSQPTDDPDALPGLWVERSGSGETSASVSPHHFKEDR